MSRPGWNGRHIRNALTYVTTRDGDSCILCGHPGANSVEHVLPVSTHPDLEWDPTNWRPSHLHGAGTPKGCQHPDCLCPGNLARGQAPLATVIAVTRGLNCSCDCTCGAKANLDQLLASTGDGGTDWRHARHLWPRTDAQQRIAEENARYTDEEAQRAATAYRQGDRTEWAVTGYNVDARRRPSYRDGLVRPPSRDW